MLKDDDGGWLNTSEDIASYLLGKFSDFFKANCTQDAHVIQTFFHEAVSFQENEVLCRVPTATEIYQVLKSMHPIKALGPDGMPAFFY